MKRITIELSDNHAAALMRLCEKVSFEDAKSYLYRTCPRTCATSRRTR